MDSKIIEIFKNDLKSDKGSELDIDSLTSNLSRGNRY